MKKIISALILSVVVCMQIRAQKEINNWAFGSNAGLTWNTTQSWPAKIATYLGATVVLDGLPTSFTPSIHTNEGCFSLSDSDGNLLFYSDGVTLWNKSHAIMVNGTGLNGHSSSAQSGIILPYPESTNKYIAVCLGDLVTDRLSYSVIDMSQDGGLGEVIAGKKNISLSSGGMGKFGETVTSIKHANEKDYWIVAPGRGPTSYFNAWLASSTGVTATAVVTTSPQSVNHTGTSGYMKFTADGKHFVWGTGSEVQGFIYGDFDNSTGVFSNIRRVDHTYAYGVEFSPSMKRLFVAGNGIYVFNFEELLAASDPSTIYGMKINASVNALQLGPDGRIYGSPSNRDYLFLIDDPDGMASAYTLDGILGTGRSQLGLPSFAGSWFSAKPQGVKSFICTGNDVKYTITISMSGPASELAVKLVWNFGDGSTATQNVVAGQTTYTQTHSYAVAGKYTGTVTPYKANGTALSKTNLSAANVVDCVLKTNRMIRTDLQNTAAKATNR